MPIQRMKSSAIAVELPEEPFKAFSSKARMSRASHDGLARCLAVAVASGILQSFSLSLPNNRKTLHKTSIFRAANKLYCPLYLKTHWGKKQKAQCIKSIGLFVFFDAF
jgi:hypothetical protein